MQIILDGNLANTLVVRQPSETHELVVASAIYSIKLLGEHTGLPRVNVNVQLLPVQKILFESKQELLDYQNGPIALD